MANGNYGNVNVPGLGTYRRGQGNDFGVATTADIVARSQAKRNRVNPNALMRNNMNAARTGGLGPLPTMSATRPSTPSPYGQQQNKNLATAGLMATQGRQYTPQQQPMDYGNMAEAMRLNPEAFKHLTPEVAAWLQMNSERQALGQQQQNAQNALQTIQGGGTTPPDLAQLLGTPGYDESYWQSRRRKAEADTRQRFQAQREMYADQNRRGGMSKAYYDNYTGQLNQKEQSAILQSNAALQREQAELTEQARLQHADRYLQQYGQVAPLEQRRDFAAADMQRQMPVAGEAYTGVEQYLRGSRNDQLAAQLGMSTFGRGGGGGGGGGGAGGGGATGVPPYVTWGGRQKITSNYNV